MKTITNIIITLTIIYIIACADNADYTVFAAPFAILVIAVFVRAYHRQFQAIISKLVSE